MGAVDTPKEKKRVRRARAAVTRLVTSKCESGLVVAFDKNARAAESRG